MSALEIESLVKSYRSPEGDRSVVVDVPAFSLDEGQHMALAGSSGSGKTTLLNLIAGILQADSGTIRISGEEMTNRGESGRDALRAKTIGYIFQTFNLLQGYTALENVALGMMFGKGKDLDYAQHLLERVGMQERMHYRPNALSVGQQQRVAVARALANKPSLVLADEPTGNLDHERAHEALDLIREICSEENAALLLVSHDRAILDRFEHMRDLSELNKAVAVGAQ